MTVDDLTAPLRRRLKPHSGLKIPATPLIIGALALFLAVFVLWAIVADDPFGGEPIAVVRADLPAVAKTGPMAGPTPRRGGRLEPLLPSRRRAFQVPP